MGFLATVSALILCGIISALLLYHVKRRRLYEKASKFPGPPTVPFLGNALDFVGNTEDILKQMVKCARLYASPFRIWLGPKLMIYVSKPEDIKKILCSDKMVEKSEFYRFFRPWLGHGLFTAPADVWRVHRKIIGPTFNLKLLESFVDIFAAQSKILVEKMVSKIDGQEFEVLGYISACTLDIICESAMGLSIDAQTKDTNRDYIWGTKRVFSIAYERMFKAWLHPDAIFYRLKIGKEQNECVKVLHRFTDNVIRTKIETLKSCNRQENNINDNDYEDDRREPRSRKKAYLDLLMELTHDEMKFSNSELRAEVDTMMVAGNDTTSTVVTSVMLMLATFQNIQDKVCQELREIYGIDDRSVTHEDLPLMGYMERVIKETMRLLPVTNAISRTINEDFIIGEHTMPKGCMVVIDFLAVHRSELYWPNPLEFDPDRFLPEEIAKRHPYSFLPFSAGPRNCIGSRFAMMEMKTILATILRRYVLKKDNPLSVSEIRLKSDGMLRTVEPIKIRIIERSKV